MNVLAIPFNIAYLLVLAILVLVILLQYFWGYKNWKSMGFLFPGIEIGMTLYELTHPRYSIGFGRIVQTVIVLGVLFFAYKQGEKKGKAKRELELEKMKAQDQLSRFNP